MSDYTQVNDYSAKDALATGNPLKIIKGSDVDAEFAAIATAIASKFDTTSIADAAEAQAGTSNTVVMTPGRTTTWAENGAGAVADIQALQDPDADRILFWDDSAGAVTWLTVGAGFTITGTTIALNTGAGGGASADRTLTAGNGLSGGGDLTADRAFALDYNELTAVAIASGDELSFGDISDSNTVKKITFANFEATLNHDSLAGFVANEHIDHSGVTLTAGVGLTGGGTIAASRTFDLDVTGLSAETEVADADEFVFYDVTATTHKKIATSDLIGTALGDGKWYRSSAWTVNSTEADVVFNTAEYDALQRGTFSTSTGAYTRGSDAGRILVSAQFGTQAQNDDSALYIVVEVNGTEKLRRYFYNDTDNDTPENGISVVGTLNLAASDVVKVRAHSTSSESGTTGTQNTFISIVELS